MPTHKETRIPRVNAATPLRAEGVLKGQRSDTAPGGGRFEGCLRFASVTSSCAARALSMRLISTEGATDRTPASFTRVRTVGL